VLGGRSAAAVPTSLAGASDCAASANAPTAKNSDARKKNAERMQDNVISDEQLSSFHMI
jgi:hypothetical protein